MNPPSQFSYLTFNRLIFYRTEQTASLKVDNGHILTGSSPGKLRQLNGNGQLFIGKYPWDHSVSLHMPEYMRKVSLSGWPPAWLIKIRPNQRDGIYRAYANGFFKKMGHSQPLFLFLSFQYTVDRIKMIDINKFLPMTGFKPWTSGIRSNRSTNWATTTTQIC